ncbi:MAG: fumarylacetoacetase [Cyclobacteriaceae bacterium]
MVGNSWISVNADSDFPIQNIPFGIIKEGTQYFGATRIGDQVINLAKLQSKGYLKELGLPQGIFQKEFLNDFIALGKPITSKVRERIQTIFKINSNTGLLDNQIDKDEILTYYSQVIPSLPIKIGDYTDFYSSEQHAFNVGSMFRDPKNALTPNWKHMPVGYHGRASSIVISDSHFHRPSGQIIPDDSGFPIFGASNLLDFELEMAFVIGKSSWPGKMISTYDAADYIFGLCLFNDWSARDIQKWEYVPLGPFLGKNFASHISPWIVTLEALSQFKTSGPKQVPEVLPYLKYEGDYHYDLDLEVYIETLEGLVQKISTSNFKYMYWNMLQQLAHHTINGCNVQVGDLMASGTISGPEAHQFGSMLELTWGGKRPIQLEDGTERTFIQDGDSVILKGFGKKPGLRIGFGEVRAQVLPARTPII